jgi:hypothetical protein
MRSFARCGASFARQGFPSNSRYRNLGPKQFVSFVQIVHDEEKIAGSIAQPASLLPRRFFLAVLLVWRKDKYHEWGALRALPSGHLHPGWAVPVLAVFDAILYVRARRVNEPA